MTVPRSSHGHFGRRHSCARNQPAAAMTSPAAAASRAGPSPFCLMQGSPNGPGGAPEICGYSDYRQCLQAGAEMHAYCVPNSDFRGVLPWRPDMAWNWR